MSVEVLHPAAGPGRSVTGQGRRRWRRPASSFGAVYLMYALLIPDTPGLAALRALIDELGLTQILIIMSRAMHTTRGFADTLVSYLHPIYQAIYGYLHSQVTTGPPLFHGPDDEHTAEKLMTDWIATIRSITRRFHLSEREVVTLAGTCHVPHLPRPVGSPHASPADDGS